MTGLPRRAAAVRARLSIPGNIKKHKIRQIKQLPYLKEGIPSEKSDDSMDIEMWNIRYKSVKICVIWAKICHFFPIKFPSFKVCRIESSYLEYRWIASVLVLVWLVAHGNTQMDIAHGNILTILNNFGRAHENQNKHISITT